MTRDLTLDRVAQKMIPVLKRHGVARAGVFGSVARETAGESSDVDVLVEFHSESSLLDIVGLQQDLEDELGHDVDVVTYRALHPRIRERVLKQQVRIL